jgi:8-oxo-dGTP pyrophosphatase MutT (NUDIX family)
MLQILIIRPIPKHKGEVPAFVLPRGSRQYRDASGQWHDARDAATGEKHAATLEPLERALAREIEEEAGVSPAQLAAAWVYDLGRMDFQSRSKGVYPIHWFVVVPDVATAVQLDKQTPADALEVRFASLDAIKTMASRGEFSAGYIPVIEAALVATASLE